MIIKNTKFLVDKGGFSRSSVFLDLLDEMKAAICGVTWPQSALRFGIRPVRRGNGVTPIKYQCLSHLKQDGWLVEHRIQLVSTERPGPVDAIKLLPNNGAFALEWETGNISSSHRALNKMAVALLERKIRGGALVIPSRSLYEYLTDRVGNYQELVPYFPIWQNIEFKQGLLVIFEIEHDEVSAEAPLIPKGKDGNAFRSLIE